MKALSEILFSFLLIMVACFSIHSCMILPVYVPPLSGKKIIETADIEPGITTKEDVLLKLGGVFEISNNETLFTGKYRLEGGFSGVLWFVGAGYSGFGGVYNPKNLINVYEVEIEFDEKDVVKRCDEFKLPRNISQEKQTVESLQY